MVIFNFKSVTYYRGVGLVPEICDILLRGGLKIVPLDELSIL